MLLSFEQVCHTNTTIHAKYIAEGLSERRFDSGYFSLTLCVAVCDRYKTLFLLAMVRHHITEPYLHYMWNDLQRQMCLKTNHDK